MDQTLELILFFPVLLFSVVAHEYAHGYAALKQGDPTAYQLGRLTLNPLKHIDPVMTIIVPLVLFMAHAPIFGGAKPVPVNPRNYRNFKRGDIIVSMAGIVTNIALAIIFAIVVVPVGLLGGALSGAPPTVTNTLALIQHMLVTGITINLVLAIFNLLPIPPLDGSHVMKYLLPPAWAMQYAAIGGAGFFLLFIFLMFFQNVLTIWLTPAFVVREALFLAIQPFMLPYTLP